ncbi:MAG: hypothetical protein SCALA702_18330 [Melioribacteraceae bacterium]|nr:MAG: hypothetical protein SCALA702_18330 [Melioribacteraceae bacterium]
MLKKLTVILLLVIALSSCSTEQKRKETKLNSTEFVTQDMREEKKATEIGVKSRTLTTYFYEPDAKLNDLGYVVEEIFYDEIGNKAVQIRYAAGGLIDLQYEWHYDDDGNMRYSRTTDMYGKELYYRESEYNYEGDEIKREEREKKGSDELETLFTYDENKLLTEKLLRKAKGSVVTRTVYTYSDSNIIHLQNFDVNGKLKDERLYTYDSLGYVDTELLKQGEHFSNKTDYKFDSAGRVLEIDEGYFRRTFIYNQNGDVLEEYAYNQDGFLQQKLIFEYNEKGLIKSRIKTDGEETPVIFTKYEYEFF